MTRQVTPQGSKQVGVSTVDESKRQFHGSPSLSPPKSSAVSLPITRRPFTGVTHHPIALETNSEQWFVLPDSTTSGCSRNCSPIRQVQIYF